MLCKYTNTFVSFSGLCISFAFVIASYSVFNSLSTNVLYFKKKKKKN